MRSRSRSAAALFCCGYAGMSLTLSTLVVLSSAAVLVMKRRNISILSLWDVFVILSIIPTTFLVIYQAFFNAAVIWHWAVIYIGDVIYVFAVIVRCCRSYRNYRGEIVTDKGEIFRHYLCTSFVYDFLTIIPFEVIAMIGGVEDLHYYSAILRLNRTLRLYKIWMFLYKKERMLGTNDMLFMCLRFLFLGAASVHIIAGIWFATACTNKALVKSDTDLSCSIDSWATHQNISWKMAPDHQKYVVSLYWAVTTVTTVGYGDITPKLTTEKWVALFTMLWGVIIFGFVLGELASFLTNADAERMRYIHQLNVIREQLNDGRIGIALRKRVVGFYEYLWERNKGNHGVTDLFNQLPLALQAEVKLDSYRRLLEKSSLFRGTSEEFLRMLALKMTPVLYLPHQMIVEDGEVDSHIYIVQMGEAEVLKGHSSSPVTILREGDVFGEGNIIHRAPNTLGMLRARTHCNMLRISKGNVLDILQHFSHVECCLKKNLRTKRDGDQLESDVSVDMSDSEQEDLSLLAEEKSRKVRIGKIKHHKKIRRYSSIIFRPLLPGSRFLITWDLLVVLVTILICWIYSYQAAFTHYNPKLGYMGSTFGQILLIITYVFDCVLIVDILVSMKRAISTPIELITKPRTILLHYVLSKRFVLDILAILPLELLGVCWMSQGLEWKYIPIFRLNRLLKIWKVQVFFRRVESSLHISIAYLTLLKYGVYILTIKHFSACIWFYIACYSEFSCHSNSWAVLHNVPAHTTVWENYLICIYWSAATMTTVGYGDISAYNTQEMVVSMVVQLVGVMLYGYCLGIVAAILTNIVTSRVSYQEKMDAIHQFMLDHRTGRGLRRRVDKYLTLLWKQYNGIWYPGGERLLHDMPLDAQEDVYMRAYGSLLAKVHLFAKTNTAFLRQLSLQAQVHLYAPGDFVMYSGDMGRHIYCVKKGYVEVLSEDLFHVVRVLGPGSYFGEIGFVYCCTPHEYTVRAATNCQLLMIDWASVETLLPNYEGVKVQFESVSSNHGLLKKALSAAAELDAAAMRKPMRFHQPTVKTGLAVAMTPSLSVVRFSPASHVASCIGDSEIKQKIAAPISVGMSPTGFVVRYKGKKRKDQDGGSRKKTKQFLSCCLLPCVIVPGTKFYYFWQLLTVCFVLLTSITFSIQAAFLHQSTFLWAINYLLDIFFIVDMAVNMYTGYYDEDGEIVTRPTACILHYLKTFFILDLISSFPIDFVVFFAWTSSIHNILRVLSLVRINRLLKLYRLPLFFKILEEKITILIGPVKVLELFIYMSMGTHLTACIWFMLACSSLSLEPYDPHVCDVESWAFHYSQSTALSRYSVFHQYIVSLYWATATTTSVGYGDIRAHTHLEMAYCTVIMIYGVVAYGFLTASVAASLMNDDAARAQYCAKLKSIKWYLADYEVNTGLTKRVLSYYKYLWKRTKGVRFDTLTQGMTPSLKADMSIALHKRFIDRVPLFSNTELGFTKLLALSIKPITFPKGEYIVRKGDVGAEMYFIHRGSVEIVSEEGNTVFALMKEGQFFGEISLIFDCPRTASIRAANSTDLFALSKTDLYRALSYYPHIRLQIHTVAGKRAGIAKKRSVITAHAKAEGMSPLEAAEVAALYTSYKGGQEPGIMYCSQEQEDAAKLRAQKQPTKPKKEWNCCMKCMLFTIRHNGPCGSLLYWIGCLLCYYSFFTISYQAAFQDTSSRALWTINYLFEAYFLIEIFLKFHLTYVDDHGNLITDMKKIVMHNLTARNGFIMDCITLFPYELLVMPISDPHLRVAMVLYMRVPHLARVIRVKWMFDKLQRRLHQQTFVLQMFKSVILVVITTHAVTCVWYFLGCRAGTCYKDTWAGSTHLMYKNTPHSVHFGTSYYWAVTTMTTVGYGDLTPTNVVEMVFAIIVMVLGKLLFGFVLGTVASTLANAEIRRVVFEDKLKVLLDHLKKQHVSPVLRQRVFKFFEFAWLRNEGTNREDLLSDLSYCLRAEVAMDICGSMLRNVTILKGVSEPFLRSLSLTMKPCVFLPGDYIVHKGDIGYGMFFIHHGQVELVDISATRSVQLRTEKLRNGDSFGLKSLIFSIPVDYSARALSHVDVFAFSGADFVSVLQDYPHAREKIQEAVMKEYGRPMQI